MSHQVQQNLFETAEARTLLDQLLERSELYRQSKDYMELLDFVVRLRNFAPFNAMLLQIQKPGLGYAASAKDWYDRFGRVPKEGARPLLILWPFGPVALVYDVLDTEGKALPEDVAFFPAKGTITDAQVRSFIPLLERQNIEWLWLDAGDQIAGRIRVFHRARDGEDATWYRMQVNQSHAPAIQFATLVHELGHLFLGHLGSDKKLKIHERAPLDHSQCELEAESVAYLVCKRNGVTSKSERYLAQFAETHPTIDYLDLYQVMHAAGQVENILGLPAHTSFAGAKNTRN